MQVFNPSQVDFPGAIRAKGTYMMAAPQKQQPPAQPQSTTLGAQAVRGTGSGPFDAAYRQNLATYAGGGFARPGGSLSFNPTGSVDQLNAGNSLLAQALGGSPFHTAPPVSSGASTGTPRRPVMGGTTAGVGPMKAWADEYFKNGSRFRMDQ